MAFDKTPTAWLANWSEDGTNITVPLATFPELTAAEADASTGDIRKIIFAILEKLWGVYNALPAADRPNKVTIAKAASANMIRNSLLNRFIFNIETDIGTQEVRIESSSSPSASVSSSPSASASSSPSTSRSASVSSSPSASVSHSPSTSRSASPSHSPSTSRSSSPSASVSSSPSTSPSASVSSSPSTSPSSSPSTSPSSSPSAT